ncbi:MAG: transporter substrate-binding domain-containing protein, partial [Beijerinckiaceae bacterium]
LAPVVHAQPSASTGPRAAPSGVVIPNYWDTLRRPDKIETGGIRVIRFLVDDEYPPFHFSRPDGTLTGFSVDLARALCAELKLACTVQARRWDTLLDSLADGRGDAVIAAMKITPDIRARFRVTSPWHRSPARFVTRKDMPLPDISVPGLKGKMVAVVANSAHAAFLRDLMPDTGRAEAPTLDAALALMRQGNADAVFADGVTLSLWLAGGDSADCCQFVGGPYLTIRYFGEGVGIIVRKEESLLKQALDQALVVVADKGIYGELYLKYFPLSFY